jgi:hypothetical protein
MPLKAGWMARQFERAEADVRKWPAWMRKEAGFEESQNGERKKRQVGEGPKRKKK